MAEKLYTDTGIHDNKKVLVWSGVTQADTFQIYNLGLLPRVPVEISVQVSGTFGGATVNVDVSNDGVVYTNGTDYRSNVISVIVDTMKSVAERPMYLKPIATGGVGQVLKVTMVVWH